MEEFEAEDDLMTLKRAKEVLKDEKRKKRALEMAQNKIAELAEVTKGEGVQAL